MTVREIALAAAAVLQADDIESAIAATPSNGENIVPTDQDVKTLVKCVNLAVAELNSELPVVKTAHVAATNGIIPLSALTGTVSTVREVRRGNGAVPFSLSSRGIGVRSDGEYDVLYSVSPADAKINSAVEVSVGADPDVLCYLSARNYCLVTGRNDEASIWDQRYGAELEKRRILRRAHIPPRAWV